MSDEGNKPTLFESKEFLELRDAWYEKLNNDGFQDIEHTFDDNPTSYLYPGQIVADDVGRQYFAAAQSFYWAHDWRGDGKAKIIWKMHADGMTNRMIMKSINTKSSRYVQDIISRLRAVMKDWIEQEINRIGEAI